MIVKDEASNLEACFESVLHLISTYCICDTGSTDGTPELIRAFFDAQGIEGEVLHHEWKNFGHNRTLASQAARGRADIADGVDAVAVVDEAAVGAAGAADRRVPRRAAVVERLAEHNGQIIWATKRATGADLGFYAYLTDPGRETDQRP